MTRGSSERAAFVVAAAAIVARLWLLTRPRQSSFAGYDLFHYFYPAHAFTGAELAAGRLPAWNPYIGLGTNVAADPGVAAFYPPNLLFALAPTAWVIELLATSHVALAAVGVFALCRATGLGVASAAVGGITLATAQTIHALTSWPTMVATFAWTPLAFLGAVRLAADPGPRRALFLGLVLGLQALAGYFQFHLYTAFFLPLFAWPRQATRREVIRVLAWLATAEAIGLGLAAVQVLPAIASIPGSVRSPALMGPELYEFFPVGFHDYRAAIATLNLDTRAPIYAGVLAPLLVLGALFGGTAPWLRGRALVLTAAAVVLSLGSATPIFPLLWRLPVATWFTGPYKWTYFAGLGAALLAACGADAIGVARLSRSRGIFLGIAGVALLLAFPFPLWARAAGALAILATVTVGVRGRARTLLPVLVGAAALAGMSVSTVRPFDHPRFFSYYRDALHAAADLGGRTFMMLPRLSFSLRQGEIDRVPVLNTYETIFPERMLRYLTIPPLVSREPSERTRALARLRAAGVRHVLAAHGQEALAEVGLTRVYESTAADLWEDPHALPRVYVAEEVVTVEAADALAQVERSGFGERKGVVLESEDGLPAARGVEGKAALLWDDGWTLGIEVEVPTPAMVVVLDAWSRDWRATVDGVPAPIRRANVLARAVEVPAGRHEVVFRFLPVPLLAGAAVSAVTLLGVALVLWRLRARTSHGDQPDAVPEG